jgi:hypothetical protein
MILQFQLGQFGQGHRVATLLQDAVVTQEFLGSQVVRNLRSATGIAVKVTGSLALSRRTGI